MTLQTDDRVPCPICGDSFHKMGLGSHKARCTGKAKVHYPPNNCLWCGKPGTTREVRAHERFCSRNPQKRAKPISKTHEGPTHLNPAEWRVRVASQAMLLRDNAQPIRMAPVECPRCHQTPCQTPQTCGPALRALEQATTYRYTPPTLKRRRKAK